MSELDNVKRFYVADVLDPNLKRAFLMIGSSKSEILRSFISAQERFGAYPIVKSPVVFTEDEARTIRDRKSA